MSKKSLLIIEDSVSITWRLLSFLKEIENLEIIGSVRNGTSGLKRIESDKPDIVLLDLQLPGMNGLKIIETLQDKHKPYIIVFTNNSNFYFKERCMALGANEFYDKSVQFEEAVASIKKLCQEEVAI
ncbi:MAG: response regulator transcription factor [Cyclobacteriaceae bacterium]|nr:response regulator transcription factor [Cyclobacteriaceae bacterium]